MTALSLSSLAAKLKDPEFAVARVVATYQPGGGIGARVFPPTFPTSPSEPSPYLIEERWRNGEERKAVVLDQVPSQANRCEEALAAAWRSGLIRMPMLQLDHDQDASYTLIGLEVPHRAFDAYWRDSLLNGEKFDKTEIGKALQQAKLTDATALLQYDPATLVYGGWNSHRAGRQEKFPRVYASELTGWDPIVGTRKAGRMDPLNLTGARAGDGDDWTYTPAAAKKADAKLSEIGHGNIAPNFAHGGVTISEATRFATISLTAIRRAKFGSLPEDTQDAARVLMAAFALLGDRLAFGAAGIWLRSGCDLVVQDESIEWVGRGGVTEGFTLSRDEAVTLYRQALDQALAEGVPVQLETVKLVPGKSLATAIDFSLTKAESSGE